MTDVSESYLESLRDRAEFAEETLTAEQREHDTTRRQRDTLQTQCEDMQSEMETETNLNNAALKPSIGVDNQAIVDIVVEKDDKISILMQRVAHADERLETANAMATTYADANAALKMELATTTQRLENSLKVTDEMVSTDMRDEMACMAEEVEGLKSKVNETHLHNVVLAGANGDLMREMSILQESAETQGRHMQQVDAACKAAEAKVIEQRKEIEALKPDADMWICPNATMCGIRVCEHVVPHSHKTGCSIKCLNAPNGCIKLNTCKECATPHEEKINRDAVILEQERKADRTDDIIQRAVTELKELRGLVGKRNATTENNNKFIIMFSGKAGDMQTPETKHACKWYNVCTISSKTSHACIANEGQHCGRKREIDAKHGVIQ